MEESNYIPPRVQDQVNSFIFGQNYNFEKPNCRERKPTEKEKRASALGDGVMNPPGTCQSHRPSCTQRE
jgi:hypothetical protein